MTAFELCGKNESAEFTIGKSKVVWESLVYKDGCDKVQISRIVETGGEGFLMGLRYKTRYISPDTEVFVIPKAPKQ